MDQPFIKRIITKPPILFPLVALFHITLVVYTLWSYQSEPFPSAIWVQVLWLLCFTVSWLFVCDMKRWASFVYMGLTTLNLLLRTILKSHADLSNFTDALFPADIMFTFLSMIYYKRFQ